MAKPVDLRSVNAESVDAIAAAIASANPSATPAQIQTAVEAALAAAQPINVSVVGGGSATFVTIETPVPSPPAVTQLPTLPTPNGALIRADEDMYLYNTGTPSATDGFLLYEGDDIRLTTVSNLDQVFVKPAKNQAIVVWAITL